MQNSPVLNALISLLPRIIQVLHEAWIAFPSPVLPDLLDDKVTASTAYVGQINEVIAAEPVLRELGLLANTSVMNSNYCTGSTIWCFDRGFTVGRDCNVLIVVPPVHLEELVVA